jgi:hypothetical protein
VPSLSPKDSMCMIRSKSIRQGKKWKTKENKKEAEKKKNKGRKRLGEML